MEKRKSKVIHSVVIGTVIGMIQVTGQMSNVSAEENEEETVVWDWENHHEVMQEHMNRMHGRIDRFKGTANEQSDNEDFNGSVTDEERAFWEERHNGMREFREGFPGESNNGQQEESERFIGNSTDHMRVTRHFSFDKMFEWMKERHGSFTDRRGLMNWNQDESSDDSSTEGKVNIDRKEFMHRFDFFDSN